jgi:hypothetical protein
MSRAISALTRPQDEHGPAHRTTGGHGLQRDIDLIASAESAAEIDRVNPYLVVR